MKKVFFANSLKGTLSNDDVVDLYKRFFKSKDDFIFPISDGGDGFLNFIKYLYPSSKIKIFETFSPEGKKIKVETLEYNQYLFIESAKIIGFETIKDISKKPALRSSKGMGYILKKVHKKYKKIFLGIGGTTTFDLGSGSFEILGYDVLKFPETEILIDFKRTSKSITLNNLVSVCDVVSPLNGKIGASLYLKQKGVKEEEIKFFKSIFDYVAKKYNVAGERFLGSGGGLGFFTRFAGGKNIGCWDFLSKMISIEKIVKGTNIVILNEGKFDAQSLRGKINGEIVKKAIEWKKKIFVITGEVDIRDDRLKKYITFIMLDKNRKDYKIEFFKKTKILKEILDG
ncbi:MAG: glycerate kinase [candidate division WOR-3 bacterium]